MSITSLNLNNNKYKVNSLKTLKIYSMNFMTPQEQLELLYLTRENYKMLRYICEKINIHESNFDRENQDDFIRNIIANIFGDLLMNKKYIK